MTNAKCQNARVSKIGKAPTSGLWDRTKKRGRRRTLKPLTHVNLTGHLMAHTVNLQRYAKVHLEALACELSILIAHAQPTNKASGPTRCWSTNNKEVDIALTVIRAVSAFGDTVV